MRVANYYFFKQKSEKNLFLDQIMIFSTAPKRCFINLQWPNPRQRGRPVGGMIVDSIHVKRQLRVVCQTLWEDLSFVSLCPRQMLAVQ